MILDDSLLKYDERAVFALRRLYRNFGYKPFKMSKFEEYDLYSRNKDFLASEGVITFNDTNGRLLALKPDVTLSILKNYQAAPGNVERLYYNENVYRISQTTHTYREIMQTGLECMGDMTQAHVTEVVELAARSLALVGEEGFVLEISHVGLLDALLREYQVAPAQREAVLAAIAGKNLDQLEACCTQAQFDALQPLICSHDPGGIEVLRPIANAVDAAGALKELEQVVHHLETVGYGSQVRIDFSIVDAGGYYSGIVFRGYLNGIAQRVLSGGRYDMLMERMGRKGGAIGFAVYLDVLERQPALEEAKSAINIALPKGRLGETVYGMFEAAGFGCPAIRERNRKLVFENQQEGVRFFWVKPSDVAIYVQRGAADIGVAGKDLLLEYEPDVYELLDLGVGKCRMAVAAKEDFVDDGSQTLRVATKFSNIAGKYYGEKCRDIDIIHLNGSIELAPLLGLSDVIVDIVETGKTLAENGLAAFETILSISARLIANKAAYQFKTARIEEIKRKLMEQVRNND